MRLGAPFLLLFVVSQAFTNVGGAKYVEGDEGSGYSYAEDNYAGSLYDYLLNGERSDEEYNANGDRSYESSFEPPAYASAEGAFDLTPDYGSLTPSQEDLLNYNADEPEYSENGMEGELGKDDVINGGGGEGGREEGEAGEGKGGSTRDLIIWNTKLSFYVGPNCNIFQGTAHSVKQ